MTLIQRFVIFLAVTGVGCLAQSLPPDVARKIEHQMRTSYAIPPDVKVTIERVAPSAEVPGYDTLSVNVDRGDMQKSYDFLLSKDRSTMLRMNKFDLEKDSFAEVMRKIDVAGRPVRGAKSSKVVVVGFDDLQCPFCARLHATLFPEILKDYGDRVTFVYKDYPITEIHPWAMHAAIDANCLGAQSTEAYWDFADYIHGNRQDVDAPKNAQASFELIDKLAIKESQQRHLDGEKLQACIKAQNEDVVRASMKEAGGVGVSTTPILFVNGQKIEGAVPISTIRAALDTALREAQQPGSDPGQSGMSTALK